MRMCVRFVCHYITIILSKLQHFFYNLLTILHIAQRLYTYFVYIVTFALHTVANTCYYNVVALHIVTKNNKRRKRNMYVKDVTTL